MAIINKIKRKLVQLTKKSGNGVYPAPLSRKKGGAGFSLVELLIVVAIIGILIGALGWGAYGNSLKKSRDGRRKADLENIRSGLEMYRADKGYYPPSLPSCGGSLSDGGVTYIDSIPCDPLPTKRSYSYTRSLSTIAYTLCAALELEGGPVSCSGCTEPCNYQRTNP